MAAPVLAPFPHHSWLGYWEYVAADQPLVVIQRRQVTHSLVLWRAGNAEYRWVHRGVERRYHATVGTVRFDPATRESSTFIGQHNPAHDYYTLLIPAADLDGLMASEEVESPRSLRHLLLRNDAVLQRSILSLSSPTALAGEKETAARRLMLRIHRLCGGRQPDWRSDGSVFDRATLQQFVDFIDAHLRLAPTLHDMAMRVALSPSHFAKKFRTSTGFSLQRFINRRRVLASIPLLQADSNSLAGIALDLGFASQSHFTRLFSDFTGMTPAKYRKQCRRTVG